MAIGTNGLDFCSILLNELKEAATMEKVQLQSWVGKHLPDNFEGDPHSLGDYVAELVTGGESVR